MGVDSPVMERTSRLAPSPTGALHLGNARTFLVNWALARREGWSLLLRIEDLDGPRVRPEAIDGVRDTLDWLGIDHDRDVGRQSEDLAPCRAALRRLADDGRLFACALSRTEIAAAASAPHRDEHELRYDPSLRPAPGVAWRFDRDDVNYRFLVPATEVVVDDAFAGRHVFAPHAEVGDFVVWTKRGMPAYQLAVVVDDARQGVTDVVRGDDLLPSAARQQLLHAALGAAPPRWWHVPLVVGPDGRRLAKRHGDTRVERYRAAGVRPQRVIGLLADWCGIAGPRREMDAAEFRAALDLAALPRAAVTCTGGDDAWLLA